MKKFLFMSLAAAAMLTACTNDDVVEMAQPKAIGFSNAFVNNSTRSVVDPSSTTANLTEFAVYGFTANGQIFDGTKVSKSGSDWSYSPLQYWVEGNTYTFGAVAPATTTVNNESVSEGKVVMTIPFTNDGATDLLHAAPAAVEATAGYSTPVAMTFNHQLAKVKFSFANAMGEGYNVKVTEVKITNAKQTGTLTVAANADNAWSAQAGTLTLDFGNVADANADIVIANEAEAETKNEKLMIPTDNTAEYTVTFKAELLKGDVSLKTYAHEVTINNVALQMGTCYDFKATLTKDNINPTEVMKPIEFTVTSVTDWTATNPTDTTLEVPTASGQN